MDEGHKKERGLKSAYQEINMHGVILAGGLGTRLQPLTLITNKHLLPVYDKPMILYSLQTLRNSGVTDIMVVCGREHAGHFMNFLGSGKEYGVKLSFALQDKNDGGIADALSYAEYFAEGDNVAVILGDNFYTKSFQKEIKSFKGGAMVFLKKVKDPHNFGVPVFNSHEKIIRIEEKPKKPKSKYAVTGFYLYSNDVFQKIKKLKPSKRQELEITDLNNLYLKENRLFYETINGQWVDTGSSFDSLLKASNWIAKNLKKWENSSSI